MILADTSVWVDHLRGRNPTFVKLLDAGEILAHPFVIGELALGHLEPRNLILDDLRAMPQAVVASHEEVLAFIDRHKLFGLGIGYVDSHLLAAARLTQDSGFWTRDKRLHGVADCLDLTAKLSS